MIVYLYLVDGGWSAWETWNACSITCGGGSQTRMRSCTSPSPANGGLDCEGASSQTQACNDVGCPGKQESIVVVVVVTQLFGLHLQIYLF